MTRLRFWWQRQRAGMPVRLGTRPSNVQTYSQLALLVESDTRKKVEQARIDRLRYEARWYANLQAMLKP